MNTELMKYLSHLLVPFMFMVFTVPMFAYAQNSTEVPYIRNFEKAKVLEVTGKRMSDPIGTLQIESLSAEILDGPDKGKIISFDNVFTKVSAGDLFFAIHQIGPRSDQDSWIVAEPYRLNVIGVLALVFILLIFFFGGIQGGAWDSEPYGELSAHLLPACTRYFLWLFRRQSEYWGCFAHYHHWLIHHAWI